MTVSKLSPTPLRAWALATVFVYPDAQRSALERFFETDSSFLDDFPKELRLLDGYQIFELNAAKDRAVKAGRLALNRVSTNCTECASESQRPTAAVKETCPWHLRIREGCSKHRITGGPERSCKFCRGGKQVCICRPSDSDTSNTLEPNDAIASVDPSQPPISSVEVAQPTNSTSEPEITPRWHREYVSCTATLNPFTAQATSDSFFELCYNLNPPKCGHQTSRFDSEDARNARSTVRQQLDNIITHEFGTLTCVSESFFLCSLQMTHVYFQKSSD